MPKCSMNVNLKIVKLKKGSAIFEMIIIVIGIVIIYIFYNKNSINGSHIRGRPTRMTYYLRLTHVRHSKFSFSSFKCFNR